MAKQETFTLNIGARTAASYDRTMNKISKGLLNFSKTANFAGKLITASFAGDKLIEWGKDAAETYKTFDTSMKNTAAIMNATVSDYERLETAARQAGRTTTKTAAESADALGYMALAGWNVEDSVKGLTPILRLAESTGKELQTTSDLVTDSMSALGISVDELDGYLDKLVMANNSANTSAEQLMYALVKSGGSARVMGADLDETIAALGIFANNGLKSSEAGTALNSLLKRWGSNSQAQKAFRELNIELYDANDNFIGMEKLLEEVNDGMKDMDANEKNAYMSMLAGRFMSQFQYLLDSVKTTGKDTLSVWDKLTDKVGHAEGALDTMNETATSSMEAAQKLLESAYSDLQITAVDVFSEDAKDFMRNLAEGLPEISDMLKEFEEEHHDEITDFLEGTSDLILNIAKKGIELGDYILDNGPAIAGIIAGIAGTASAGKVAGIIGDISLAAEAAGGLIPLLTNPAGLAVAGVGLASGIIAGIATEVARTNQELTRTSLAEHFGDLSLSIGEVRSAARALIEDDSLRKVEAALEEYGKLDPVFDKFKEAGDSLSKLNWKVEVGIKLTDAENSNYKTNIENYIANALEYADSSRYAANLSLGTEFDKDSELMKKVNAFFKNNKKMLKEKAKELNKAVNEAFSDGLLTPDETEVIEDYQKSMSKIMDTIAQSESEASIALIKAKYGSLADLDAESFKSMQSELDKMLDEFEATEDEKYKRDYAVAKTAGATDDELEELTEKYLARIASKRLEGLSLQTDTIIDAYELDDNIKDLYKKMNAAAESAFGEAQIEALKEGKTTFGSLSANGLVWEQAVNAARENLTREEKLGLSSLLEALKPQAEEFEKIAAEYREKGSEIPKEIVEGIREYQNLALLSGDADVDLWEYAGDIFASDEKYSELLRWLEQSGEGLPEGIARGISDNRNAVDTPISEFYNYTKSQLLSKFSSDINVPVKVKVLTGQIDSSQGAGKNSTGIKAYTNAEGGIYDSPILTTFAEKEAEAAIPINRKPRSVALWQKTGEMMGIGTGSVTYSPQIVIQGNAKKEDVVEAQEIGLSKFRALYREMRRQDGRVSFAR